MKTKWDFNACVSVLGKEIELLQKIDVMQDSVRKAAMDRKWIDFEWKMAEIKTLSGEFGELENARIACFSALNEDPSVPFYRLIADLPPDEARDISALYRTLKLEILKMKAMNEAFLLYLTEAKTLAQAYLEAAFPSRAGRLYTRQGMQVAGDLRSMVLNTTL